MNDPAVVRTGSSLKSRLMLSVLVAIGSAPAAPRIPAEELLHLDIARTNSNLVVTWTNSGVALESALIVTGAWMELTGAVSPQIVLPTNPASFFRLRGGATPPDFGFRYVAPTFTTSIGDPVGCGCVSPENPNTPGSGNAQDNGLGSVLLHTGELTQDAVDLEIPGRGFNWRFERRYRSGMNYDGPMGQGWDFNLNRRLIVETNGDVLRVDGLGRVDRYVLSGGIFQVPSGFYTRLTREFDGTFTERDRHGSTNLYAATNGPGIARLTRISDRNGNQMTFQYNSSGQLSNVVDTLNRTHSFFYDANGRLTAVTDFSGRTVTFAYNAAGDLVSATSPIVSGTPNGNDFLSGKTTQYSYIANSADSRFHHNLLTVTAPNEFPSGPARLTAIYDTDSNSPSADRVLSLTLGGVNASGIAAGGTVYYSYTSFGSAGSNDFASPVFQNTVTNRNGNVVQYQFNQLGNTVRSIHFTRGVRAGDPPGFTNTFVYNKDGELLAQTNAEQDVILYTFNTGSPARLQQGNLLQVQRLPGPRGGDQTQIVTSMTYETNFNFTATSTDGRGNVTINCYDAHGNRTNVVHRLPSIIEDFEYNAFGQMTAHVLPDNGSGHRRRDTMTYYSSGPQTGYLQSRVVDSGGFNLTTSYEYDSVGNVVRTIDPRGNDTLYTYNALNQLVSEASRLAPGGVRYTNLYWYDANDNRVRVDVPNRDETGTLQANAAFSTITEYDILDERTRQIQEKGSANFANSVVTYTGITALLRAQFLTVEYRYDADGNRNLTRFGQATAAADPFNLVATLYDERDLVFRETRAMGSADQSTTQTDYDRNGNVQFTLQGLESVPHTDNYSYDGYDRLVRTLDPMGNTRTNHYDANHNRISERTDGELTDVPGGSGNVRLAETIYAYDAMDRLISRADQFFDPQTQLPIGDGQALTLFAYSDNSQLLSQTDANSNRTTYAYDTAERLLITTDAKTNTVSYSYDPNSNLLLKTNLDRADVPGQSNETFKTQYVYDGLDRLVRGIDNASNTVQYAYDSRNNLIVLTNGRGNRTIYQYDGLNRLTQTDRLLTSTGTGGGAVVGGITNRQTWDDSSRRTTESDGNSNTTQYVYDSLDRLIRTQYADGTSDTNGYDVYGNRTQSKDANGTIVTTTYDLLDRANTNNAIPAPGVLGTTNETYSYDGLSRIVQAANGDFYTGNSWDSLSHPLGQLQVFGVSGIVGYVNQTMKYDGMGNRIELSHPAGTLVQTFDSLNRLKVSRFDPPGPGATNAVYQYIGPDRVARIDYGNGTRMDVGYDAVPRVSVIQHSASGFPFYLRDFVWDQAHNLIDKFDPPAVLEAREYTYDSLDRLVQADDFITFGTTAYKFDAVGNRTNVTSGPGAGTYFKDATLPEPADFQLNQYTTGPSNTTRQYDANGNLTNANGHTFSYDFRNRLVQVHSGQVVYQYDCYDRRFGKTSYVDTNLILYAGQDEVAEYSDANSTAANYVWGNGEILRTTATNGQLYFYHCDQLGSPVAITSTNGTVVETHSYDEYGTPSPASSSIGNPYLFNGQRYDPETGWYFSGQRYLDPAAGRFTTRAPDGPDGLGNSLTFANNNPLGGGGLPSPFAGPEAWDRFYNELLNGLRPGERIGAPMPGGGCVIIRRPPFPLPPPPVPSVPIEIQGLDFLPSLPSGPNLPGNDTLPPGGCPGLPDPKRSHDYQPPLIPAISEPRLDINPPPEQRVDEGNSRTNYPATWEPACWRKCTKHKKMLEPREEWVDKGVAVRPLPGEPAATWVTHKKVRIFEMLVWEECTEACDVGGGMVATEIRNMKVIEIRREDVASPDSRFDPYPKK